MFGLESGDPYASSIRSGKKVYRYADVLNLLAHMTGGRYFSIAGPDDLKEACAAIADDLRYQYVLGFETAATGQVRASGRSRSRCSNEEGEAGTFRRKGYRGSPARFDASIGAERSRTSDGRQSDVINPRMEDMR